jgi:hypothetical protein
MNERIETLLQVLDRAYNVRSWHGPNLRGALRGIDAAEAARRPGDGRHNAWEVAVHCAYWKYRVASLLDPGTARSFGEKGSDWFERPAGAAGPAAWRADLARLDEWHAEVRSAVAGLDPRTLDDPSGRDRWTRFDLVAGIAAHDLYHAGQIRLVRRMLGTTRRTQTSAEPGR